MIGLPALARWRESPSRSARGLSGSRGLPGMRNAPGCRNGMRSRPMCLAASRANGGKLAS